MSIQKFSISPSDIEYMIMESIRRLSVLNEENVWNDGGGDTIGFTNKFTLKYSVYVGYEDDNGIEHDAPGGLNRNNLELAKMKLQEGINIRKIHLEQKMAEFARKMNGLDESISLNIGEFTPFTYEAPVVMSVYNRYGRDRMTEYLPPVNVKRNPGWDYVQIGTVEATGYTCSVEYSKSGFQLGGYKYVGIVSPVTQADQNDTEAQYSEVKLTTEFENNAELANRLKQTSQRVKCDGCGKTSSRLFYYIFMDASGKIYYYGRNCANQIFGIDIMKKLHNFMLGLNKLGELVGSHDFIGTNSINEVNNLIAIMLKDNVLYQKKGKISNYWDIVRRAQALGQETPEDRMSQQEKEDKQFLMENFNDIYQLTFDFYSNSEQYFRNQENSSISEFEQKMKVIGIEITASRTGKFNVNGLTLYAIRDFFSHKQNGMESVQPENDEYANLTQYPAFGGYKTFRCRVLNVAQKVSQKNGKLYDIVKASGQEVGNSEQALYGIMWYVWQDSGLQCNIGDVKTVTGAYSQYQSRSDEKFTVLSNVTYSDNQETQDNNTIEVGTRLRDERVTVRKVYNRAILITTRTGNAFYIYILDYNTGEPKYNIDFYEGMTLNVTGTAQMGGNGKPFLNRCKISL